MLDLGLEPKLDMRNATAPKGGAWAVYKRLLGYAARYKFRLAVSLLFALIVAVSFSAMVLGVAGVVHVVYGDETAIKQKINEFAEDLEDLDCSTVTGWIRAAERAVILKVPLPGPPAGLSSVPGEDAGELQVAAKLKGVVEVMRARRMTALFVACALIFCLSTAAALARFVQEYFAGMIGANISVQLAREMIQNIMRCSLRFFEQHTTGEILARLTNDVFQVNRGLASVFVKLMREPIKMLFFLGLAIDADPVLTLAGLGVLPPAAFVIVRVGKHFKRSMKRSLQKIASLASLGNEVFGGITIVQGFCMEDYELKRAEVELGKLRGHLGKMVKANAAVGPLVEVVLVGGIVGLVLFLGYRIEHQATEPGRLVQLIVPLALILDPIRKLSSVNNMVVGSIASAERVFEFIDAEPEVQEAAAAVALPALQESLRFERVSFSYDGEREVLSGIDLEIKRGEMVAVVGFSGAGKSTLVKLIPRFYDTTDGVIRIDGTDIRNATFKSLRNQISIVTQDTILFNESIRSNIAFGCESFSDDRLRAAAGAAHASEFIDRLAKGYETILGERGGTLSGGQRQRIAIARAVIKDPAILILDEATSSLDSESERAIQEAIDEFVVGRTTIVIAHRLSTVLRADRIVVLDEGRIVEQGTHKELSTAGGIYQRLYETQFGISGEAAS